MKNELYRHPHIQIKKSPIHGYGIFATEDIPKDTVIEEVGFVEVQEGVLFDYVFLYPKFDTPDEDKIGIKMKYAIPFGFACIYNHSDNNNASWKTDTKNEKDCHWFMFG